MDLDEIPTQLRPVLKALERAVTAREPALRARVDELRAANPYLTNHQLAHALVRATRRRVAATGGSAERCRLRPASARCWRSVR